MLPDYYKILGINKNATKAEIKKSYREHAKKYHPDVNRSPNATAEMQVIQEAYFILYDDEARLRYDIQYDKVYGHGRKYQQYKNTESQDHSSGQNNEQKNHQFNDPILEKWILNAKRQSADFVKKLYSDTKGVIASGCFYYFKAVGISFVIFIILVILIRIISQSLN
jgi:curved DNA-binding protein CbpA